MKSWDSQPIVRRMRAGDVLLSSAIIVSGNNYEKVGLLFKFVGLGILSQPSHFKIQTKYSCPVINDKFQELIERNIKKYIGKDVVVIGKWLVMYLCKEIKIIAYLS